MLKKAAIGMLYLLVAIPMIWFTAGSAAAGTVMSGDMLQLTVVNNGTAGSHYAYQTFSTSAYTFQTGDYVEYDVTIKSATISGAPSSSDLSGIGGIDIQNSDASVFRSSSWTDQKSIAGHPVGDISPRANGMVYHRKMAVPAAMVGKTATQWMVAGENDLANLSYTAVYDNIVVSDNNGRIKKFVFKDSADSNANTLNTSTYATASLSIIGSAAYYPDGDILKLTVFNGGAGNQYAYYKFSSAAYTFQAGDTIQYNVWIQDNRDGAGGIDITNTDATNFRDQAGWVDQRNSAGHPGGDLSSYAYSGWTYRSLAVPAAMVGKTSASWVVAGENDGGGVTYTSFYDNIVVIGADGTIKKTLYKNSADLTVNTALLLTSGTTGTLANAKYATEIPANPQDDILKLTVTNGTNGSIANKYVYRKFSDRTHVFMEGDYLEYDVKISNNIANSGGIDITLTDGTDLRSAGSGWADQNAIGGHPNNNYSSYAYNGWYHRKLKIPDSAIGKIADFWTVAGENDTSGLTYSAYYDNIVIRNAAGYKDVIYGTSSDAYLSTASVSADIASATTTSVNVSTLIQADNPRVQTTTYSTDDVVIKNYDATDSPYSADKTGAADATKAIQFALNEAGANGGGVVYLPAGTYKILGHLSVPANVTLRGDWKSPETSGGIVGSGTVLKAYADANNELGLSFIRLSGQSSGLTHLSIWYPDQVVNATTSPTPYPWTIEVTGGFYGDGHHHQNLKNITLVNSYKGIYTNPSVSFFHFFENVYATCLKSCVQLWNVADVGRITNMTMDQKYWVNSGFANAPTTTPDQNALKNWAKTNGVGLTIGDAEWENLYNVNIKTFDVGLELVQGPRALPNGNAFKLNIDDVNYGVKMDAVSGIGWQFSRSAITGYQASFYASPKVNAEARVVVDSSTLGSSNTAAPVLINGNMTLMLQNNTFTNWSGLYAIAANYGTFTSEGNAFSPSAVKKEIYLGGNVVSANILGNTSGGAMDIDNLTAGNVVIDNATAFNFPNNPVTGHVFKTTLPKPSTNNLFNAKASPYNAAGNGVTDDTAAIQNALDAAYTAGGGTVYLPPGQYKINTHLSVPAGVELRGSSDGAHMALKQASTLFAVENAGNESGTPFIKLNGNNAGVRGISIYYPNQPETPNYVAYPWSIQGNGTGVYVMYTTLVNSYKGVDFATNNSDNHYINYLAGTVLKQGIYVGRSATEGWIENVSFNNLTYWARSEFRTWDSPEGLSPIFNDLFQYTRINTVAFQFGHNGNEHLLHNFAFGSNKGYWFTNQSGYGSTNATVIGAGIDGGLNNYVVDATGANGVNLVNTNGVSLSGTFFGTPYAGKYVTVSGGTANFYNSLFWGAAGNGQGIVVNGGNTLFRGGNMHIGAGNNSTSLTGGVSQIYNFMFSGTGTQINVGSGVANTTKIRGNIGVGGLGVSNSGSAVVDKNISR